MSTAGVLAVIPARYESSRFPGKPLARILGVPMIVRVHERVATAIPRGQILVATDDARIRDVCAAEGIEVVMTSPAHRTGTDRVHEAIRDRNAPLIVNVQGDEPLISGSDITAVLAAKRARPDRVANAMCVITDRSEIESPNVPKVLVREDGSLVYMSRSPVPFIRNGRARAGYFRQVCIYAFTPEELRAFAGLGRQSALEEPEDIEILRFLDLGIGVQMVEVSGASVAVDVPCDIARVEALMRVAA